MTTPIPFQPALDSGASQPRYLLKLTRPDGAVFGMTSDNVSATIDGVVYDAENGIDVSAIATSEGLGVDNLELSTLDDGTLFTRAAVLGGVWQRTAFLLSRYDKSDIDAGLEPLLAGTFGNIEFKSGSIVVELRGLQQYLQQSVGNVTTRACRAHFADYPAPNGNNLCRLTAATYTVTATVSAVASKRDFTSADLWVLAPVDDFYGEGLLTWTTGANTGMSAKVKAYVSAGAITLMLQAIDTIVIGDEFSIIAGCRKRRDEDCGTKFGNALNFQGEPDLPGIDHLTANADASV